MSERVGEEDHAVTEATLKVGDTAPDVTLGSADGDVSLSSLYRDGPIVLAFLRHFG